MNFLYKESKSKKKNIFFSALEQVILFLNTNLKNIFFLCVWGGGGGVEEEGARVGELF